MYDFLNLKEKKRQNTYSQMFSRDLIDDFLSSLQKTHDIREIMHLSRYPFNVVEMLNDLKDQGLVRIESDGWHLTPQGEMRVEGR